MARYNSMPPTPWEFGKDPNTAAWERMFESMVIAYRYAEDQPTDEAKDEMIAKIGSYAVETAAMPSRVAQVIYEYALMGAQEN
jgi:hypothetical protein